MSRENLRTVERPTSPATPVPERQQMERRPRYQMGRVTELYLTIAGRLGWPVVDLGRFSFSGGNSGPKGERRFFFHIDIQR